MATRDKPDLASAVGAQCDWRRFPFEPIESDTGSAFRAGATLRALNASHATYSYPTVGEPHFRGVMERVFGTISNRAMPYVPGRTFPSPPERGDYPTEKTAILTDDQLALFFVRYVVDVYHQTPHRGLLGETRIIVLVEIQHVRAAGPKDKKSMRDALKSLVQPHRGQVVPILIGMPEFGELLNSDQQFKRRYSVVHMTTLDPAADVKRAIQILARYCKEVKMQLGKTLKTRDFAERLLHASHYAIGEMCSICILAIKTALIAQAGEITIDHFRDGHTAFGLAQDRKDLGFAISRHLHQNPLRYLAEEILLPHPLSFEEDYHMLRVVIEYLMTGYGDFN